MPKINARKKAVSKKSTAPAKKSATLKKPAAPKKRVTAKKPVAAKKPVTVKAPAPSAKKTPIEECVTSLVEAASSILTTTPGKVEEHFHAARRHASVALESAKKLYTDLGTETPEASARTPARR